MAHSLDAISSMSDDAIFELFAQLTVDEFSRLCRTNQRVRRLCESLRQSSASWVPLINRILANSDPYWAIKALTSTGSDFSNLHQRGLVYEDTYLRIFYHSFAQTNPMGFPESMYASQEPLFFYSTGPGTVDRRPASPEGATRVDRLLDFRARSQNVHELLFGAQLLVSLLNGATQEEEFTLRGSSINGDAFDAECTFRLFKDGLRFLGLYNRYGGTWESAQKVNTNMRFERLSNILSQEHEHIMHNRGRGITMEAAEMTERLRSVGAQYEIEHKYIKEGQPIAIDSEAVESLDRAIAVYYGAADWPQKTLLDVNSLSVSFSQYMDTSEHFPYAFIDLRLGSQFPHTVVRHERASGAGLLEAIIYDEDPRETLIFATLGAGLVRDEYEIDLPNVRDAITFQVYRSLQIRMDSASRTITKIEQMFDIVSLKIHPLCRMVNLGLTGAAVNDVFSTDATRAYDNYIFGILIRDQAVNAERTKMSWRGGYHFAADQKSNRYRLGATYRFIEEVWDLNDPEAFDELYMEANYVGKPHVFDLALRPEEKFGLYVDLYMRQIRARMERMRRSRPSDREEYHDAADQFVTALFDAAVTVNEWSSPVREMRLAARIMSVHRRPDTMASRRDDPLDERMSETGIGDFIVEVGPYLVNERRSVTLSQYRALLALLNGIVGPYTSSIDTDMLLDADAPTPIAQDPNSNTVRVQGRLW